MLSIKHAPIMAPISTQSQSFTLTQLSSFAQPSTSAQPSKCAQLSSISVVNGQPRQMLTVNIFIVRQLWSRRGKENPLAILSYNKWKSGVESSDQTASHATSLRKEVKWYCKLAIDLIL